MCIRDRSKACRRCLKLKTFMILLYKICSFVRDLSMTQCVYVFMYIYIHKLITVLLEISKFKNFGLAVIDADTL